MKTTLSLKSSKWTFGYLSRSPSRCPFTLFLGRLSLLKWKTTERKGNPYSNLSTGGPSCSAHFKEGFVGPCPFPQRAALLEARKPIAKCLDLKAPFFEVDEIHEPPSGTHWSSATVAPVPSDGKIPLTQRVVSISWFSFRGAKWISSIHSIDQGVLQETVAEAHGSEPPISSAARFGGEGRI